MSKGNFQKFIGKKETGAKLKESIRQEKKQARKEKNEYFEKKKQERFKGKPQPEVTDNRSKKAEKPGTKASSLPMAGMAERIGAENKSKTAAKPRVDSPKAKSDSPKEKPEPAGLMPLNKFVAHAGVSSRRDAADLIRAGKISVNNQVITEPGFKVTRADDIRFQGKKIVTSRNLVYILLNKPKDHITTTEDPEGRKTVMDIIKNATNERVYPIGRLDRNTTGVLLLTNDGELAQKLSHPSYEVRKIYEVTLDRPLVKKDFDELLNGITLEDGFIAPDSLAYADSKNKAVIGIEIHSGKNRIVRRIFEKLGYDVRNLDRVMYANLTKKNVERGKWRFLQDKEIRLLKFMNASYAKKK